MTKEKKLSRMRAALRQAMMLSDDLNLDLDIYTWRKPEGVEGPCGKIRIGDYEIWVFEGEGANLDYCPLRKKGEPTRTGEWESSICDKRFVDFKQPPTKEEAPQTAKKTAGQLEPSLV